MRRQARIALLALCAVAGLAFPSTAGARAGDDRVEAPSRAEGASLARIVAPTVAQRRPGADKGGTRLRPQTEWSGQAQTLMVLRAATHAGREWLKLRLASRPNGSAGWVPRDHVVLGHTPYWIEVRTRSRRVAVYRDGKRVRRFGAVVGAPGTPTPHGLAAIYEKNRQPDPGAFLGPWVLSLTAFSNVLENFGGGPGRAGLHGRSGASFADPLGSARSHGCVRVNNNHIRWLASHVPAGTPVSLRP